MIKKTFSKFSTIQKIYFSLFLLILTFLFSALIPTLSNLINTNSHTKDIWDGTIASSFERGNGSKSEPFEITNGSQLAYLSLKLKDKSFKDEYFAIKKDIYLNEGIIKYKDNDVIYELNNDVYYIKPHTNQYYENSEFNEPALGTLNMFPPLENFEGNFIGNFNTIYGLYITEENDAAFFKNLDGNIEKIVFKNCFIYGTIASGIATKAENSTIKDVSFDGFVISNENKHNSITNMFTIDDIYSLENEKEIELDNNYYSTLNVISAEITGEYFSIDDVELIINDQIITTNIFQLDLGSTVPEKITVKVTSLNDNAKVEFNDMKINVFYHDGISSGVVGVANNVLLANVVNKSTIISSGFSGGLIGKVNGPITIKNSYNEGIINSVGSSGGIIASVENSSDIISINNVFNNGELMGRSQGDIIGIVNNNSSEIDIVNSFSLNSPVGFIDNSSVSVTDSYSIFNDNTEVEFTIKNIDYFYNKENLINDLKFKEFINEENLVNDYLWIYEKEALPKLYFDKNENANLHVTTFIYNNFFEPDNKYVNYNIGFTVDILDDFSLIEDVFYHVNDNDSLTRKELNNISEWNELNSLVTLNEEGTFIIYIKLVDYQGRVKYINSDKITIDFTKPEVNMKLKEQKWNILNESPEIFHINQEENLEILAEDNISGIEEIKYYLTDKNLSQNELKNLETWNVYDKSIAIKSPGKHIVYIKVTDRSKNVTYINSDYIYYNGFTVSLKPGINDMYEAKEVVNLTNNSNVTYNFNYSGAYFVGIENYTRFLKSNQILPSNTRIKLINNSNKKIYEYITTNDDYGYNDNDNVATYPFTLFKEVGVESPENYKNIVTLKDDLIIEDYTIIFQFENVIESYENLIILFELNDNEDIITTLNNDNKIINIHYNKDAYIDIENDYSENQLIYGSGQSLSFNIKSDLIMSEHNLEKIYDTTFENLKLGLKINVIDEEHNLVHRKYLKDLIFKVNEESVSLDTSNYIRLPLDYAFKKQDIIVDIEAQENITLLKKGTYYIVVEYITSYDGIYSEKHSYPIVNIPLISSIDAQKDYSFDVKYKNNSNIFNKDNDVNYFDLTINKDYDTEVFISLYEKENLTAYDQKYKLVNIDDYILEDLIHVRDYKYNLAKLNVEKTTQVLTLKNSKLNNNGYKLVFELYKNDKVIEKITKYFIMR